MITTIEQLQKILEELECEGTTYFTGPTYVTAIVGMTEDGRLVYEYHKMVDFLMEQDKIDSIDAIDFIEYNTIRTIPYMGEKAPIIIYNNILDMV